MPFRKKVLYYGLMLLLTLLALEGMARIAYYAAYGQAYAGGGPSLPVNSDSPPTTQQPRPYLLPAATEFPWHINHPFYAFSQPPAHAELNIMPPRQRREDTVIVALLGGSVAEELQPFLQRALDRWFAAKAGPKQPAVLRLAVRTGRQPQQTLIVANHLLLGGEFDLIVNLDGLNEMVTGAGLNHRKGVFPAFPQNWRRRVALTSEEILLAGQIAALRREQARRAAAAETSPLRRSALFGLVNRRQRERTAAAIIQRNHELAAAKAGYSLEKHGPRSWLAAKEERLQAAARFWYRSSLALAQLAELAGAEYYHFLQPNQYVPGAKPLSLKERDLAYKPESIFLSMVEAGYPLLREFGRDLQSQDINYFDLTGIFLDHPETLYIDGCCHLNARGNELLAAAMAQRLGPALLRRGGTVPAAPDPVLAAAGRPEDFRVSLQEGGKQLRYVREDCAAWDTSSHFFLHLIPRDLADLPPGSRRLGLDNRDFRFDEVGGRLGPDKCTAQIPLPDYPIAALRTGQFVPGLGDLWSVELIVPIDTEQLRADYAALAAAEPTARDYFDLYDLDNRLIYLRENCAAADTAAGFFLHIIPENPADLPADKRAAGFAHAGFDFARQGGYFDGKCLAAVALPDYPVKEMRTGQHIPGQDAPLWSVQLIAAPDFDQLRADYAALSAAEPAARAAFDLYLMDGRLIYRRESCAVEDTAAGFFLHIVPENPADLPAERREAGFAHAGFVFARQGGHFDGKCLASVALPDYPIKEMRTGQFVPGQGDLWSARLGAAP